MARAPRAFRGRSRAGSVRASLALALALSVAGCDVEPRMPQQTGVVVSARFDAPPGTGVVRTRLANGGRSFGWLQWPQLPPALPGPDAKIDRPLRDAIAMGPADRLEEVLIEYRDIPTPPAASFGCRPAVLRPPAGGPRSLVDSLLGLQSGWYAGERETLASRFGGVVLDSFGITRSLVVRVRLDAVRRLASRPIVEWIGYAHKGGAPPEDCADLEASGTVDAFVSDGRAVLGSDPYRERGYATGRLALLDSGVLLEHELLRVAAQNRDDSSRPGLASSECLTHADCRDPEGHDVDLQEGGHGTKTCGILVADGSSGACFEGATRALVRTYRVFRDDGARGALDPVAYKRACQQILDDPAPVAILEVAEVQAAGGVLGRTAARLYRRGVAVISAAGNWTSDPGAPGSHPYVLSVGTRDLSVQRVNGLRSVTIGATSYNQCRGAVGHRRKPDLQAPSQTPTAGAPGVSQHEVHTGSSGAVPYAGVAALILRNWMAATATSGSPAEAPDPGQVYAAMLACCEGMRAAGGGDASQSQSTDGEAEPGEFPLDQGAGLIRLPASGRGWWGKVEVGTGGKVPVPLVPPQGSPSFQKVSVAIWWPDPTPPSATKHRDADLELLDADGTVLASSKGTEGVFERLDYPPPGSELPPGPLTVRISGVKMGSGPKPVYFAATTTP